MTHDADPVTQNASSADVERFAFGRNWQDFLGKVDDERVAGAVKSLRTMLGTDSLEGTSFLDVGCGSGLFSLAARELGATVRSFDFDQDSVDATQQLRQQLRPNDPEWSVEQGSALDDPFLASLGRFDIVYAWGVLHHTGDVWRACELVARCVADDGRLFISIYNDQGLYSRLWRRVKRTYVRSGPTIRRALVLASGAVLYGRAVVLDLLMLRNPLARYSERRTRGMSRWTDLVDWVGGYPFEVAKPEQVFDFYRDRGFVLEELLTCGGGHGCNQFVLRREDTERRPP